MLTNVESIATVGVKDLKAARAFYEGKLGLKAEEQQEEGVASYRTGASRLFVYESQYAGTNRATAVTWIVGDDVAGVAQKLRAKGIAFEHYDMPDTRREGDVHLAGGVKVAWFKDPDGNIHSIVNG